MQSSFTKTQMTRRADRILRGVRTGKVPAGSDAIAELAELTIKLNDQPVKPVVVARLTVTRANGVRTIVEVWEGATFHSFYRFFKQQGSKRSTKELIRVSNRNEGCQWIGMQTHRKPGLETIARKLEFYASQSNPVVKRHLRILRKRAYKRLLNTCPKELGLTQVRRQFQPMSPARS